MTSSRICLVITLDLPADRKDTLKQGKPINVSVSASSDEVTIGSTVLIEQCGPIYREYWDGKIKGANNIAAGKYDIEVEVGVCLSK